MASSIQYPVGKFQWPSEVTAADREKFIDTIEKLPGELRSAVAHIPAVYLDIPYRQGGWSICQMVHHIPDSHMNSYLRFKLALTEDQPAIKTYEEARWAELADARTPPIECSLALLEGLHGRWVTLLRGMSDADFQRTFRHPELGLVSLKSNLALYDWHCRHHLAQIVQTAKRLIS